jgi:hypothetical protein
MSVQTAQYTVTTTASQIIPDGISAEEVHLHCAGTVYIGNSAVTSSNGLRMDNGDKITFNVHGQGIWACTSTGTNTIYAMWIDK